MSQTINPLKLPEGLPQSVQDELEALFAIYEQPDCLYQQPSNAEQDLPSQLDLQLDTRLPEPHEDVPLSFSLRIPPLYPDSAPVQLALASKYLGAYSVEDSLRSTISSSITDSGLWTPGTESVCYEALEHARELCQQWYEDRLSDTAALGIQREEEAQVRQEHQQQQQRLEELSIQEAPAADDEDGLEGFDVDGVQWTICEPILDRKSVFIAHAAPLDDPKHVKPMLRSLKKDKKIAKATHNIVAWRCRVNGTLHLDNDDDGETAAGGRMAHLLSILETDNVVVCCTRWFGGVHLGPDRFKHINSATRNALEAGGFLKASHTSNQVSSSGKAKNSKQQSKR